MDKKVVIVMFGGVSPEHEVSIITGLQVLEHIDRELFDAEAIFVSKQGEYFWLPKLTDRKGFEGAARKPVSFGCDSAGGYLLVSGLFSKKIHIDAAYLAFHGGIGESGQIQGMLESFKIPFTSSRSEGAAITMNKGLTKLILQEHKIPVVVGSTVTAAQIKDNTQAIAQDLQKQLGLPVIIKPVHLGSSIGIKVANTAIELEKFLLEASHIDNEVLIEELLTDFVEYNCAVRLMDGTLEASEIERPISHDEILSFADKYQRGAKKTGGSGMASLSRDLPAKIPSDLHIRIQEIAKEAFLACHCKGMVRVDFMMKGDQLYLTEINPIPGSMAFYLWEASGIPFKQQISDLIQQAINDAALQPKLDYQTDIVSKFVNA